MHVHKYSLSLSVSPPLCLSHFLRFLLTGRVDPVPFEQKDDHMGLGRWTMEVRIILYFSHDLLLKTSVLPAVQCM